MEKRLTLHFALFVFLFLGFPFYSIANGPPINSDTAFVTGLNGAAFRSFFKVLRKSKDGDGEITVLSHPLIYPYELLDNELVLIGQLPLLLKDRRLEGGNRRTSGFGIGDFTFLTKYNLYQKDWHAKTFRVAVKAGLEFPTGNTNHSDDGGALPRMVQNGKGSWNPLAGAVFTYLIGRFGVNWDASYQLNTEGKNYEFGDELKYDVALAWRFLPKVYKEYPAHQINGFLELNGSWTDKDKNAGVTQANSGGHLVYLSPGLQYLYQTVVFESSFQYPIIKSLNGQEPDWSFNFGFRWLIF